MSRLLLVLLGLVLPAGAAAAQAKKEPLVERVKTSIDKAVRFLRESQRANGSFEVDLPSAAIYGGWSSLATLALLNAGVPVSDPMVERALGFLRELKTSSVYVRALQTMVFVEAKQTEDKVRVAANVKWLIDARVLKGGKLAGWTYSDRAGTLTDNSNTQYALLGLWAGSQGGAEIKRDIWESIRAYYLETQRADGSWVYSTPLEGGGGGPSMTMTAAGLSGLLIAGMELTVPCATTGAPGKTRACGVYPDSEAIHKAGSWIGRNFIVDLPQKTFYHLYGLERTGRLSGERFVHSDVKGDAYDWYREGCAWLVDHQQANGSFSRTGHFDQWPVVSTSFALLFLSKGRTPVLMSKLVHYDRSRGDDLDWNNDRSDLRHLVPFAGKHLFKELPLAWQTYDVMRAARAFNVGAITEDDIADIAADMLQAPVLYITGHASLLSRITGVEKKVLRRFAESGGFIFVEACCSSPAFDAGFKKLLKDDDLWPDNDLVELDSKHPVWKSHFLIDPGNPYKLHGLALGCKTILIYSPQDMSCFWEANLQGDGKGDRAFKLGTNIIAYATGKEPPKPRLTEVDVARGKDDPAQIRRGFLRVAQIRHGGDWHPAPNAMRNLMDHVSKHAGIHVVRATDEVRVFSEKILAYKFLYMHGRAAFSFDDDELERLRFNLEKGGALLFADACCGSAEFDKSFRTFVTQLFPKGKLERVPEDDLLFARRLSGEELNHAAIRARTKLNEEPKNMAPYLEGIRIDGRWVLLYSKYDIGCALEGHSSSDCLGYTPDSALKIASAAVLYTYWPSWKD